MEPSDEDIILEGGDGASVSISVSAQGNPRPDESFQSYQFRLHEHQSLGWRPELSPVQYMQILNNLTAIRIRGTYFSPGEGFIDAVELETALVNKMIEINKSTKIHKKNPFSPELELTLPNGLNSASVPWDTRASTARRVSQDTSMTRSRENVCPAAVTVTLTTATWTQACATAPITQWGTRVTRVLMDTMGTHVPPLRMTVSRARVPR